MNTSDWRCGGFAHPSSGSSGMVEGAMWLGHLVLLTELCGLPTAYLNCDTNFNRERNSTTGDLACAMAGIGRN